MTRQPPYPLDSDEGPTVWADTRTGNKHTIGIIIGTDPDDPMDTFVLSHNEVNRLHNIIQMED